MWQFESLKYLNNEKSTIIVNLCVINSNINMKMFYFCIFWVSKLKHELCGSRFYIWILDLINNRIGNLQIWANHWCTLLHPNFNMKTNKAIHYKLVVFNSAMCFLLCFWIVICASQMKYLKFSLLACEWQVLFLTLNNF